MSGICIMMSTAKKHSVKETQTKRFCTKRLEYFKYLLLLLFFTQYCCRDSTLVSVGGGTSKSILAVGGANSHKATL